MTKPLMSLLLALATLRPLAQPHRGTRSPAQRQIHFYDKLNPVWWFRNLAEPIAPAWYRPNDPHRNLKYHLRNPGANFCRFTRIRQNFYANFTN